MGTYERIFGKSDARKLWPTLVLKATKTHYQIRQHSDGTYQVIRGRYESGTTPWRTARTIEAAIRFAARH